MDSKFFTFFLFSFLIISSGCRPTSIATTATDLQTPVQPDKTRNLTSALANAEWYEMENFLSDVEYERLKEKFGGVHRRYDKPESCGCDKNRLTFLYVTELFLKLGSLSQNAREGNKNWISPYTSTKVLAKELENDIVKIEKRTNFFCSNDLREWTKYSLRHSQETINSIMLTKIIESNTEAQAIVDHEKKIESLSSKGIKTFYKDNNVAAKVISIRERDTIDSYGQLKKITPFIELIMDVKFINETKVIFPVTWYYNSYDIPVVLGVGNVSYGYSRPQIGIGLTDNFDNNYSVVRVKPELYGSDNESGYQPNSTERFEFHFKAPIIKSAKSLNITIPVNVIGNREKFSLTFPMEAVR